MREEIKKEGGESRDKYQNRGKLFGNLKRNVATSNKEEKNIFASYISLPQ